MTITLNILTPLSSRYFHFQNSKNKMWNSNKYFKIEHKHKTVKSDYSYWKTEICTVLNKYGNTWSSCNFWWQIRKFHCWVARSSLIYCNIDILQLRKIIRKQLFVAENSVKFRFTKRVDFNLLKLIFLNRYCQSELTKFCVLKIITNFALVLLIYSNLLLSNQPQ